MLSLTSLDFDDIVNQLTTSLQQQTEWSDVPISSTTSILIDSYAYIFQLLMYYLKRTAEENFIDTAQFWTSLVRIANMLNLYVKRNNGAYGPILLTSTSGTITLPAFTQISIGGVNCYTTEEVVLQQGNQTQITVTQGTLTNVSFTVSNTNMQTWEITDTTASDQNVVVTVNGVNYEVVTDLFDGLTNNRARIYTTPDQGLGVQMFSAFGMPGIGTTFTVTYPSVIYNWVPVVGSSVTVTGQPNITAQLGNLNNWMNGSTFETVDQLRSRMVDLYRVGKRLVTQADFQQVFQSLPGVQSVSVVNVTNNFQ